MKKIILLGLLLFIVGCTTQTGTQAVQTGPNLYENDYYSLEYPSGWIEAEAMDGQKLSLLGPTEDFVNIVISCIILVSYF